MNDAGGHRENALCVNDKRTRLATQCYAGFIFVAYPSVLFYPLTTCAFACRVMGEQPLDMSFLIVTMIAGVEAYLPNKFFVEQLFGE